ncbi:MAG: bifunctional phosphopantothenoylcysteine decarboxylase/phosphopantothenate--cysteine ligase CoaBC [Candidatus Diapherotrites archaeon]|nr:bifunctional phosphopantothenoylcysteine decarboxylase/phosphopantothenate--cysteine ligase CoaBC [Candidatus Diapherotrites archaeon]
MEEILASKSNYLKRKLVVLGITGSVACVRVFDLCRELIRRGAGVQIVASKAALEMVGEKALEFASGRKVISEITGKIEHVEFFGGKGKADLLLVAPATANTISKIAMGIDDSPVTTFATTAIGKGAPVLIAPAMHEPMYDHPIVNDNLRKLESMNRVKIIAPLLSEEKAKLAEIETICLEVERAVAKQPLAGKKILIAAGKTEEEIDATKVLATKSSGKTGLELGREAYRRGAQVTLLHNTVAVESCIQSIPFSSAGDLEKKVVEELSSGCDVFICPAAISDFSVEKFSGKLDSAKKFSLELTPREKLLEKVRQKFPGLAIVGFKALAGASEKELVQKARQLLQRHSLQLVVANDVSRNPPGSEETSVAIVSKKKAVSVKGKKSLVAARVFDELEKLG